jgi:hypothetical protein
MSEICESEAGCAVSIEPPSAPEEEKKEEVQTEVPVEEELKEEEYPEAAEIAGALGLMTAVCQISPEDVRESCWNDIIPLEEGKKTPKETIRAYATAHGTEELEKSLDVLKKLIEEAKKEVK